MSMPARKVEKLVIGKAKPRIGPPTPARSMSDGFVDMAKAQGIELFPWQATVGRYLYALAPGDRWLYPEVAAIVARQNGKTALLLPHILTRLAMKRRIIHASHGLKLPRKFFFDKVIPAVERQFPTAVIRRGAGQESVTTEDGGEYTIVASTGGAPRGLTADDLLLDEVRELDEDFVGSAMPTLTMSPNPQVLYLSNAGEDTSEVLNAIRARAGEDSSLAYLEWSAAPERAADDVQGWAEANPSMGHVPHLVETLERAHKSYSLSGNLSRFETEHLCRWVKTMREPLVDPSAWILCHTDPGPPRNAAMGMSMAPDGQRASIAIAWLRDDDSVGLQVIYNGPAVDTNTLGKDAQKAAQKLGIKTIGFDPLTDAELAKFFKKPTPISGQKFANASAIFVNRVNAGKIAWSEADPVTDDLTWTSRKEDRETGSYQAVRAQDDRSITASLAAIRAVWLASGPKPAVPKVM